MTLANDTFETVAELVRQRPERSRIFEELGIDFCCHGHVPLDRACVLNGLDLVDVCRRLEEAEAAVTGAERDWTSASLTELTEHIVELHHRYLRRELPRLAGLIDRVLDAHGEHHPELRNVREVFAGLQCELLSHMLKEEQVLFPMIRQLERTPADERGNLRFHCGTIGNPIAMMEHEHDTAGKALQQLDRLTHHYQPPDDACPTYRALLSGLEQVQSDLHLHIHKENNILFPAAAALEPRA
ncbi:MAG: iron-sulfur cluster repair di-iron protein [Planctomycetaceae bacterium]|nr:iron-sulfur cluster repair di-iron protein [Planctomycetaceae bacterium]